MLLYFSGNSCFLIYQCLTFITSLYYIFTQMSSSSWEHSRPRFIKFQYLAFQIFFYPPSFLYSSLPKHILPPNIINLFLNYLIISSLIPPVCNDYECYVYEVFTNNTQSDRQYLIELMIESKLIGGWGWIQIQYFWLSV